MMKLIGVKNNKKAIHTCTSKAAAVCVLTKCWSL